MTTYIKRFIRGKWRVYAKTQASWGRIIHKQLGAYNTEHSAECARVFFTQRREAVRSETAR